MQFNVPGRSGLVCRTIRPFPRTRAATGRSRFAQFGAIGAVVPLLAGLAGPSMLTDAAAQPHAAVRGQAQVPVPVRRLASTGLRVKVPVMRSAPRAKVTWPAAGAATAILGTTRPAAAVRETVTLARTSSGSARAGALPLGVGPPESAAALNGADRLDEQLPASVRVTVASHAVAVKAGVSGVIFTLARADGGAEAGSVHLSLDYASFADADWGYAGRLRLVELPGCALTTPEVPACRRETPVQSSNDVQADAIGADVTLPMERPSRSVAGQARRPQPRQARGGGYVRVRGVARGNDRVDHRRGGARIRQADRGLERQQALRPGVPGRS